MEQKNSAWKPFGMEEYPPSPSSIIPIKIQIGGDHYKKYKIQPVEYIHANNLDFFQGSVVKYITRFRDKNGIEDLKKAKHFIDLLIELEYGKESSSSCEEQCKGCPESKESVSETKI